MKIISSNTEVDISTLVSADADHIVHFRYILLCPINAYFSTNAMNCQKVAIIN